MYYLNYVNRLQEAGLQREYIKELTAITVEASKIKPHEQLLHTCLNLAKQHPYGLMKIIDTVSDCDPNEIYRHIRAYLRPFNAHDVLKELILTLIRDGASIANILILVKPLLDMPISYSTLSHLVGGVGVERSELSFNQRQKLLIEIVKYIKYKGIAQDYMGYFLLKTLYPEVEGRVIASAIVKSIDHLVKSCTLCGSEFITASKHILFCDKCRKKRRAV